MRSRAIPTSSHRLESVYAMGGALFVPGNVRFGGPPDNAVAEWNIYVDPTAAQAVIDSGLPVRLVSLDGTSQVPVTQEFAQRVAEDATGPGALVLAELFAAHPFMTDGTYFLWDPLAAAVAAGYPLGSFSAARVDVEEAEGPEVGLHASGRGDAERRVPQLGRSGRGRGHAARDAEPAGQLGMITTRLARLAASAALSRSSPARRVPRPPRRLRAPARPPRPPRRLRAPARPRAAASSSSAGSSR